MKFNSKDKIKIFLIAIITLFLMFITISSVNAQVSFYNTNIISGYHFNQTAGNYTDVKNFMNFTYGGGNVRPTEDKNGIANNALNMSASGSNCGYIKTGNFGAWNTNADFSLSFWVTDRDAEGNDGIFTKSNLVNSYGDLHILSTYTSEPTLNVKANLQVGTRYHYVYTFNKTPNRGTVYLNNVSVNYTNSMTPASNNVPIVVGTHYRATPTGVCGNITFDELVIINKTLLPSEVEELYSNYDTWDVIIIPPITPTYNITINNTPNINTSTLFTNITANVQSNNTNLTNDVMTLYSTIKTTLNNNCSIFYQTVCIDNGTYKPYIMNKIDNKTFYKYLTDTEIFPAYYPYNYTSIDNSVHYNETIYSNNNILFNITNFSTQVSKFNILLEMDLANKTSVNSALLIYYCNSSYTSGNPSLRPESCELIDSYMSDTYIHTHNNSKHTTIPVVIQNITKTQNSYIIFVGQSNALNGWIFSYVNNTAYNNASFRFGAFNAFDAGSTKTNKIFDIHIHPFNDNDYISYYSVLNDSGTLTQSSTINDVLNLVPFPPSASNILSPECSAQYTLGTTTNTTIDITWTPGSSINNYTFTYNLTNRNTLIDTFIVGNLPSNQTAYNWSINSNILFSGANQIQITTCDQLGSCDTSISCEYTICKNSYVRQIKGCISGLKLINYTDINGCNEQLDLPSDTGQYEECSSTQYVQTVRSTDTLILIILAFFLIIGIIIGVTVHEAGFGLSALMSGLMLATFLYYDYPDIITYACIFMIIVFSGMWILVARGRR